MPKLVKFPNCSVDDVPTMLRNLADKVEKRQVSGYEVQVVCVVRCSALYRDLTVYGMGPHTDADRAYYLLGLGRRHLEDTER